MDSSFIIITTLHPDIDNKNSYRHFLHLIFLEAIKDINYKNFKVYLFGHRNDSCDGNLCYVKSSNMTKEARLEEAKNYFLKNNIVADYVLRLDDDDIINPTAFKKVNELKCDVYCDEFHSFYDLSSGLMAQQKRNWIANTCIMKYDLAFKNLYLNNALFFNFEHNSTWLYYFTFTNVNMKSPDKTDNLYLRILSPTSITSRQAGDNAVDVDRAYRNYLLSFGSWNNQYSIAFVKYIDKLKAHWISKNERLKEYQF